LDLCLLAMPIKDESLIFKKIFSEELKNSGNVGLKTNENIFSDYIEKYNELKGTKIY